MTDTTPDAAPRIALRHRLEYRLFRGVKALLRTLSPARVRRFGHGLGRLGYRLLAGRRRLALANLRLALPELGPEEHQRITRACFEHFGATFCEIATADRFSPEDLVARFDITGWEHVDEAMARGRGAFLMTGHFGAWELMIYPLGKRLGEFHAVARPPNNPLVERDLRRIRQRFGVDLVDKKGAGHRMLNILRRRAAVGIVIDQRIRQGGILVPFFGQPSLTSPVVAYLSLLRQVPVVPGFCYPVGADRFEVRFDPPIEPEGKLPGPDNEAELTRRYLQAVEDEVRRRPELWLWMHRRWQLER